MTPELRARMLALLERIEWGDLSGDVDHCPSCRGLSVSPDLLRDHPGFPTWGHSERCELAAVLRELRADVLLVQAPFIPGEGAISLVRTCCAFHSAKDAGQLRTGKFYQCCDPSEALQEPPPHGRP